MSTETATKTLASESDWYLQAFTITVIALAPAGPGVEQPITAQEIAANFEEVLEEVGGHLDGYMVELDSVVMNDGVTD